MVTFLTRSCLAAWLLCSVLFAQAVPTPNTANADKADAVLLDMANAFQKSDRKKLTQLLPQARGHVLEAWAAFWELRVRLGDASDTEVKEFLSRYSGTYQEDRMRTDWLLVLGQRQEWTQFEREYALYRMHDDKEVECYADWLEASKKKWIGTSALEDQIRKTWLAQRQADDGCTYAVEQMLLANKVQAQDIWHKARLMVEFNRKSAARDALRMVSGKSLTPLDDLMNNPAKFVAGRGPTMGKESAEWITLGLVKLAANDYDVAVRQLNGKAGNDLTKEQKQWVWGVIGRQSAMKFDSDALDYFAKAGSGMGLTDEMLAWKVRAALRADDKPQWAVVVSAIDAMSASAQKDPAWIYWRARAVLAQTTVSAAAKTQAQAALQSIAGFQGFYEQLAEEELGRKISLPPRPTPVTVLEANAIRNNPSLLRAMYAIRIGLRQDGVKEWNYGTALVDGQGQKGRMTDREKLAAAQWACEEQIWDRCINTSERTALPEMTHRYPTPFKDEVLARSKDINIDPAYVYGLIRQESRFILDARSSVGASGLMQIMPGTAKWTAKKIGLKNFHAEQLHQRETNIAIGTAYLKLVLDNFQGSMPMAAAAYNAGPSRSRKWRNGPLLEGAIWAECVPFSETRDYVKKVLSNTTLYAAVLTGEPQSLKARLGKIGPRDSSEPAEDPDLP
jgi:soluble lytic murein transglycosylase